MTSEVLVMVIFADFQSLEGGCFGDPAGSGMQVAEEGAHDRHPLSLLSLASASAGGV